jgi:hypothetical protein
MTLFGDFPFTPLNFSSIVICFLGPLGVGVGVVVGVGVGAGGRVWVWVGGRG